MTERVHLELTETTITDVETGDVTERTTVKHTTLVDLSKQEDPYGYYGFGAGYKTPPPKKQRAFEEFLSPLVPIAALPIAAAAPLTVNVDLVPMGAGASGDDEDTETYSDTESIENVFKTPDDVKAPAKRKRTGNVDLAELNGWDSYVYIADYYFDCHRCDKALAILEVEGARARQLACVACHHYYYLHCITCNHRRSVSLQDHCAHCLLGEVSRVLN